MIVVKNSEEISLSRGVGQPSVSVVSGFIDFETTNNKKVRYKIMFQEKNKEWTPPVEVPAVEAKEATENSPAVEAKEAYMKDCGKDEFIDHGHYHIGEFTCNHEDNILLACHNHAIEVLGPEWEITKLRSSK